MTTPTFVLLTPLERRCCVNGVRLRAYGGAKIDGTAVACWIADVPHMRIDRSVAARNAAEHQGLNCAPQPESLVRTFPTEQERP